MPAPNVYIKGVRIHRHLLKYMFPQVVGEEIDTNKFLNACRTIIQIIDKFGKVFAALKYDMQCNIEKLSQKYNADRKTHVTLQSLILSEKKTGRNAIAGDALLWLARGLKMIQTLFDKIIEDERKNESVEDLTTRITEAYDVAMPHEWMAYQLLGLLGKVIPTRTQLLLSLADNNPGVEVTTINTLDIISQQLHSNLTILKSFLCDNNLGHLS